MKEKVRKQAKEEDNHLLENHIFTDDQYKIMVGIIGCGLV